MKLRYEDFSTVTRDSSLPVATDDPVLIRKTAGECLKRVSLDKRLRLLGVRVGNLSSAMHEEPEQLLVQGELPW